MSYDLISFLLDTTPKLISYIYKYILLVWVGVCLFVSKTAELIGPIFLWDLT